MESESHTDREARARKDEATTENADDAMPDDPFDRSPEDYDVNDTLAALKNSTSGNDETRPNPDLVTNDG